MGVSVDTPSKSHCCDQQFQSDKNGEEFLEDCSCAWCISHKIREKGNEYGTTTGRPRRVGWLDIDKLIEGIHYTGATEIALMHVDTLCGMDEVKIYVGGDMILLRGWEGWTADDSNFSIFQRTIEARTGLGISFISFGPRDDEIRTS